MTTEKKIRLTEHVSLALTTALTIAGVSGNPIIQVLACIPGICEKGILDALENVHLANELQIQLNECTIQTGELFLKELQKTNPAYYEFCSIAWPGLEQELKNALSTDSFTQKLNEALIKERNLECANLTNKDIQSFIELFLFHFYICLGNYPALSNVLIHQEIRSIEENIQSLKEKQIKVDETVEENFVVYISPEDIIGREETKQKILQWLDEKTSILNICGAPGIGKSTVCYYVLQDFSQKEEYILKEINARGCTDYALLLSRLLKAFGCLEGKNAEYELLLKIRDYVATHHTILIYLDNFEDCLNDKNNINLIKKITQVNNNVQIILSSRYIIGDVRNIEISPLDIDICVQLFCNKAHMVNPILSLDKVKIKDFIEHKLDCHTGSIILIAANVDIYQSWDEVENAWDFEREQLLSENGFATESLTTSLYFSYNRIKDDLLASSIWGCFSFFPAEISENILIEFFSDYPQQCKDAIIKLRRHKLIERNQLGYFMLQPIRDRIFCFAKQDSLQVNGRDSLDRILDFFLINEQYIKNHFAIVAYTLRYAISSHFNQTHADRITKVIRQMLLYCKTHPYEAIPLLYTIKECAEIYYYLGELHHILGNNKNAIEFYDKALNSATDLSSERIAQIYCKECEIFRLEKNAKKALKLARLAQQISENTSYHELAISAYWQEGEIYRLINQEQDKALDFFLHVTKLPYFKQGRNKSSDVLWSIGEIYRKKGKNKLAHSYISQALKGYETTENIVGKGYAYLSFASLNGNKKNSNSLKYCEQAYDLFQSIGFELGCGHALKWKGNYLYRKNPVQATECLNQAMEKYTKVGYKSGIQEVEKLLKYI